MNAALAYPKRVLLRLVPLMLALPLQACAHRPSSADALPASGYLVTGDGSAEFGLLPSDTLPELQNDQVPAAVRAAASNQSELFRYDPLCTRYFRADTLYVAIVIARCEAGRVVDDGEGMAVYTERGAPIGTPTPMITTQYTVLRPEQRNRH